MEPPLGFEFEESVFEGGSRDRKRGSPPLPYSARRCEPEWFCEETKCEDDAEAVNVKKFRGDLAYKCQEFKKALSEYSDCLALLPPSNLAMRRDVLESQARCLAHLRKPKEALEIAEQLRNGATNTDHVTAVLGLELAIFHTLDHIEKIIEGLQQLIALHPFHPGNWKLLAEAYMQRVTSPALLLASETDYFQGGGPATGGGYLPASSAAAHILCHKKHRLGNEVSLQFPPQTNGYFGTGEECQRGAGLVLGKSEAHHETKTPDCDSMERSSQDFRLYACASFVRARLLYQLTESNQSSFALERNLQAQREIKGRLASMGWNEKALSLVTQGMAEDLVPEKLKEDAQGEVKCIGAPALTSLLNAAAEEFESKWFHKLKENFSHLDCWT
ncbi:hypothetical protein JRQ81_010683 [Phrynocephalus forsythii]|uniref:Uncharacterized protein n=1 Tax=Phrynocephalus forsythii TaxID=171643 RepID=A0A9Q1B5B1_9SAUR|nr:hypothetical protein JRQ81_010683 [Phrynocephalus forsythii]